MAGERDPLRSVHAEKKIRYLPHVLVELPSESRVVIIWGWSEIDSGIILFTMCHIVLYVL